MIDVHSIPTSLTKWLVTAVVLSSGKGIAGGWEWEGALQDGVYGAIVEYQECRFEGRRYLTGSYWMGDGMAVGLQIGGPWASRGWDEWEYMVL